jgi:hypothetical protein
MKRKVSILVAVSLMTATVSWGTGSTAVTPSCTPVGRILSVENDSQITAGKLLCAGDTLQPASAAKVAVLCYAGGKLWNVPSGRASSVSEGCPKLEEETDCDPKNGCTEPDPRGPAAGTETPYIISPYDTAVLNDRPALSWYPVKGATSYTVVLRDITGSEPEREKTVAPPTSAAGEIRIDYPFNQALQPGGRYKLIVGARSGAPGNPAAIAEARFQLLAAEDAQVVRDTVAKINSFNLPKEEKVLLDLYSIYSGQNLIPETREMLEELVREGSKTAKVYRLLGDIYLGQTLLDLAKQRYETAAKLAAAAGDSQELEKANAGLNIIRKSLEKRGETTS